MTPADIALIIGAIVSFVAGVGGFVLSAINAWNVRQAEKRNAKKQDLDLLRETYEARIGTLEKRVSELETENTQIKAENVQIKAENKQLRAELDEYTGKPRRKDTGEIKPIL